MNVFDIIGPVMIGPSSSHTAGAVRLGRVAWKILEEKAKYAYLIFVCPAPLHRPIGGMARTRR